MLPNTVKKLISFGLILLLIETLIIASLVVLYIWVDKSVCPSEYQASGHCYTDWFSWFEWGFYCLALILIHGAILWLTFRFFQPLSSARFKALLWFLTLLLVGFIFVSELRFIGQTIIAIAFIHGFEFYLMSKYKLENR